jgi:hypothetical protein
MIEKRGGVTRRGLLWAGGLAAIPLPPAGAFTDRAGGMPWEPDDTGDPAEDGAEDPRNACDRPGNKS